MSILPPVATQAEQWSRTAVLAACIVWVPVALVAPVHWNTWWTLWSIPFVMIPLTIIHVICTIRGRRELERRDFQICPECLYPLAGVAVVDHCPECGAALPPQRTRAIWRRSYGLDYSQRP